MIQEILNFYIVIWKGFQAFWFIILPLSTYWLFKNFWLRHIGNNFAAAQQSIMIELIPPRELEKSPQLMEKIFDALAATDKGPNIWDKYLSGYANPNFSLEVVGNQGTAHFYIRIPVFFRALVESALYAHYPEVEIREVPDYTENVPKLMPNKQWKMWSIDYKLLKHDAYPIRTYKHFQEDITGKMIDPLGPLLESMGALGPGQQIWVQYIISADRPNWFKDEGMPAVDEFLGRAKKKSGGLFGNLWKDLIDVIGGFFVALFKPPEFASGGDAPKEEQPLEFRLSPSEKQVLTALEENVGKNMFNVKMRGVVIGRAEGFTKANITALMAGTIKQFSSNHLNSIIPHGPSKNDVDYILKDLIVPVRTRKQLERYVDRDPSGVMFRLSSEELATVFHMPDMSVVSPSVQFVDGRASSAPANLPFEIE